MSEEELNWKRCQMGLRLELEPKIVDDVIKTVEAYTQEKCREAEIALLRETAEGFQLVLEPEFAKGGQAAINALIKMADHKEGELKAQLNKSKGE